MEHKALSKQALKKLENMDYDEKVRLFARLCLMRQNKEVVGIIVGAVGEYELNDFKAEITHHLYDQNDQYGRSRRFSIMLRDMINGENIYDNCDSYTLCAYMYYYEKFIKLAEGSRNSYDLRYAKEKAYHATVATCDEEMFNISCYNQPKFGQLLNKDYRKSVVDWLIKDLKIENGYKFAEEYFHNYYINEDDYAEAEEARQLKGGKIDANCVEAYTDKDGYTYYLDADGNMYYADEVADYQFSDGVLSATDNGFEINR